MNWRCATCLPVLLAAAVACRTKATDQETGGRAVPVVPQGVSHVARPFPKGPLFAASASFQLAVYYLPQPRLDPQPVLRELLSSQFPGFDRIGRPGQEAVGPTLLVAEPAVSDYAPPDLDQLTHFGRGLSPELVQKVQGAQRVMTLSFRTRTPGDFTALRDAYRLASELARATGGLIWDEETRELFSTQAWDERRVVGGWSGATPHVPAHTLIHAYANPELLRSVTLGMAKLGLPDVVVNDVPRSNGSSVGDLINLACQTMAERASLEQAGRLPVDIDAILDAKLRETLVATLVGSPQRKAALAVTVGTREEGDPENRLLEITFAEGKHGVQEGQAAVLDRIFGSSDQVTPVQHDEALLAASRRAQREIVSRLKPLFRKGLAPGERLLVKAPFATSAGTNEWMWVEVVRWQGRTIHGILMNDPEEVPGLKAGARVEVSEAALFDYIHRLPDGSQEGNETGRMMEAQAGQRQKQ